MNYAFIRIGESMKSTERSYHCLSGSTLKIIAIVTMLIDHIAACLLYYGVLLPVSPITKGGSYWTIYQIYKIMRGIGRIAFPIFCFLLVEGFFYTSNRYKYTLRLFLFCLLSEIPFDLAFSQTMLEGTSQNVFFTLFIGFLTIWAMETVQKKNPNILFQALITLTGCSLAAYLRTDYDYKGVFLIVVLYFYHNQPQIRNLAGCISLLWEPEAMFAFIPINMYNGKRGLSLKYFFYLFYPVHLLILAAILQTMI